MHTEPVPRAFGLDPEGRFLIVAGLDSGRLASYQIDQDSGELTRWRPIQEIEATNCGLQGVFGGVHGSVFPASQDFLFVVDWDSFFTLFCGKQDFVGSVVAERQLEGFFSDESTSHWWSLPEAGGHL